MSHACPGPGDNHYPRTPLPTDLLACAAHWRQVNRPTQLAVLRAWDGGLGMFDEEYLAARDAAISQMRPLG